MTTDHAFSTGYPTDLQAQVLLSEFTSKAFEDIDGFTSVLSKIMKSTEPTMLIYGIRHSLQAMLTSGVLPPQVFVDAAGPMVGASAVRRPYMYS